jgi:arabinose-5-phosphate isomerase
VSQTALAAFTARPPSAIAIAVESLHAQARALKQISETLGHEFAHAVDLILACSGRIIISGMGKSGLIGKKMAATFASTGTPSFFIHPGDAFHGDLGMIRPEDLVVLISYSGETDEVTKLIPSLEYFGNPIVAFTGKPRSTLGRHAHVTLDIAVERETCPHNLAPTTSTLVTMALGDALAVALMKARDFQPLDFARYHPGGSLGRRLLTRVRDVMHKDNLPFVRPDTKVRDCMLVMTAGRLGLALAVADDRLKGIITDGDLRRGMLREPGMMDKPVAEFMSADPKTIEADALIADAEAMMHEHKIRVLVVMGERGHKDDICGVLEIFDRSASD